MSDNLKPIATTDSDIRAREALEVYLNQDSDEIVFTGFYDSMVSLGCITLNVRDLVPPGYALVPAGQLADGSAAQKAFWHALEFCNDPDDRNIRRHWNRYKAMIKAAGEGK